MKHKLPSIPIRIVVAVIVLGTLAYFGFRSLSNEQNGTLSASGTIEAVIVNVAPEMAGKVSEVLVDEGQPVSANEPLLLLDPSLLTAQQVVAATQVDSAKAALAAAQTKYDQSLQAALAAQDVQGGNTLRFSAPDEFNQPAWYFNQTEQTTAAQSEVDSAKVALSDALSNMKKVVNDLNNANYVAAEERLAKARVAFQVADSVKIQAENAADGGGLQDAAYDYYNAAREELNQAQKAYNALLNSKSADDVRYARGKVIVAQQRYDAAYSRLLTLQTGAEAPAVLTAAKALDQAQTSLAQAKAGLALIDAQVAKLTVTAPMSGVVLTRNVEPGEFVQPGADALTIADLSDLTITVYVPEDRYGLISLGQSADVKVDSFPDLDFTGEVVSISDQAEYTPRNIQTAEGRSTTMFAIKLRVDDPEGKLKPGMPADVTFK
jgi:HlyD family secretion protein